MKRLRPIREKDVERKVVAYCKKQGLVTYKFTSPSYAGVPDRIIMGNSRILFLELKKPGGVSTPLQTREQQRISCAGIPCAMADNFEAAVVLINETIFGISPPKAPGEFPEMTPPGYLDQPREGNEFV